MDAYFKELETTLTKIDMHESEESKMARFVSDLRRDIQDVLELYEYSSLEKVVHLGIKVESQLSKKNSFKKFHNDVFYHSSWKNKDCTALVVGSDDVAPSHSVGLLTRCQICRRGGSRGVRVIASY